MDIVTPNVWIFSKITGKSFGYFEIETCIPLRNPISKSALIFFFYGEQVILLLFMIRSYWCHIFKKYSTLQRSAQHNPPLWVWDSLLPDICTACVCASALSEWVQCTPALCGLSKVKGALCALSASANNINIQTTGLRNQFTATFLVRFLPLGVALGVVKSSSDIEQATQPKHL